MKMLLVALALCLFGACNDQASNGDNRHDSLDMHDTSTVHPPEDAIPDSMKIKNDSVIVTDSGR